MKISFIELGSNKELARQLFEKTDNSFNMYLGYEDGIESAVEEVTTIDARHKYWVVYNDNEIIGLTYIYDYNEKYKKCSLGYGLLPEYRGRNLSVDIVNEFCEYIESAMNIIRIQADIELTNKQCIRFMGRNSSNIGFNYECIADNYWGQGISCEIYSRCSG